MWVELKPNRENPATTDTAMRQLEAICVYMVKKIRETGEMKTAYEDETGYEQTLRRAIGKVFPNGCATGMMHITHWVLIDYDENGFQIDYSSGRHNSKDIGRAQLKNPLFGRTELKRKLEKYRDDVEARLKLARISHTQ